MGYLSEQLFEVGADQNGNLVPVQQVEVPLGAGVEVHDPVGVSVEGAGAFARVHRDSWSRRRERHFQGEGCYEEKKLS